MGLVLKLFGYQGANLALHLAYFKAQKREFGLQPRGECRARVPAFLCSRSMAYRRPRSIGGHVFKG